MTNKFILIRNAPEYSETVKKGNEKVIEPRLADAKFFFDEDLKGKFSDNVENLRMLIIPRRIWEVSMYKVEEVKK